MGRRVREGDERFADNILRIVGRAAGRLWRIDLNYAVLRIP